MSTTRPCRGCGTASQFGTLSAAGLAAEDLSEDLYDLARSANDLAERALAIDSANDVDRALNLAGDLEFAHAHAEDLAEGLADREADLGRAHDLAQALATSLYSAHDLAEDLCDLAEDRHDLAEDLYFLARSAYDLAERAYDLDSALGRIGVLARTVDIQRQPEAGPVVSSPVRLLAAAAARLLPATDRGRYADEYTSELSDLALIGASRLRQLRYGLRQLLNAPRTSLALRSPRRRSAAP